MASNDTITITNNNTTLFNVNMSNVTKLSDSNFLIWSHQAQALLDGYDLARFLDGTRALPTSTVTTNSVSSLNPAHTHWKRQDRFFYSALLGAISPSIQPLLSKAKVSAEIWTNLNSIYAKPSRGHIKQIKQQLKSWTKGNKSIHEYVQGFIARFDQLALLGKVVDLEEQIEYVLAGLPEEYKPLIDQIESQDSAPTLSELHEKLLNHDLK